jgi:hypothetical protein
MKMKKEKHVMARRFIRTDVTIQAKSRKAFKNLTDFILDATVVYTPSP